MVFLSGYQVWSTVEPHTHGFDICVRAIIYERLWLKGPVAVCVHGPGELVSDSFCEDALDGQIDAFAEGDRDSGIHIVDLRGC